MSNKQTGRPQKPVPDNIPDTPENVKVPRPDARRGDESRPLRRGSSSLAAGRRLRFFRAVAVR